MCKSNGKPAQNARRTLHEIARDRAADLEAQGAEPEAVFRARNDAYRRKVLQDKRLTTREKVVLTTLLEHVSLESKKPWPSHATLANETGLHRRKAIDTLQSLKAKGWLTWTLKDPEHPHTSTNEYRFRDPDKHTKVESTLLGGDQTVTTPSDHLVTQKPSGEAFRIGDVNIPLSEEKRARDSKPGAIGPEVAKQAGKALIADIPPEVVAMADEIWRSFREPAKMRPTWQGRCAKAYHAGKWQEFTEAFYAIEQDRTIRNKAAALTKRYERIMATR